MDYSIIAFVVGPAISGFMSNNGWGYVDDVRENMIKIMRKHKARRKIHLGLLKKALEGMKDVFHLNHTSIHCNRKKYLRAWSKMCKKMGNGAAVKVIGQYLKKKPKKTMPVFKGDTPMHEALRKSVKLFKVLVMDVAPALNAFHKKEDDPFVHLKSMRDETQIQENYLGSNGETVIRLAFKGRHSVAHFFLDIILKNYDIYLESFIELCLKMGDGKAAYKIMKRKLI